MATTKGKDVAPFEDEKNNEVALTDGLDKETIDTVESYDALMNLIASSGMTPIDANEAFNGGFTLVDKSAMSDIPHVIMDWKFSQGKYGEDFVIVRAMTTDDRKVVYNDGSTGIRQQLKAFEKSHGKNPVYSNGLRVSTYTYVDKETGDTKPSETWYIG